MAALPAQKIEIVRALLQAAPDAVLSRLAAALIDAAGDNPMVMVRRVVEAELADRRLRDFVLAPIAPLCRGASPDRPLSFPPRVLPLLWRALKAHDIAAIEVTRALVDAETPDHRITENLNDLTADAADALRARAEPDFDAVAEISNAALADSASLLARCLDLAPVARSAIRRLPEWLAHPGGDTAAAARIAHSDAVAIADDAGPIFFHMLAAHLAHRWMVLRIISAVMDKPTERYLADSELAGFGEAVLDEIESLLATISKWDLAGGVAAGRDAARRLESAVLQIAELESSLDLNRETGWGKRIVGLRARIAALVESRLRDAEKLLPDVLPAAPARSGRGRGAPLLDRAPQPAGLTQALSLLAFADGLKTSMNPGGFASVRSRALERLGEFLTQAADDALEQVRATRPADLATAREVLSAIADMVELAAGVKTAELVRRRAAVAVQPPEASEVIESAA